MVISDLMTLSRSDFVRRIRLSFWTSRWRAALGVRFADHANALISGVGLWHTGLKAVLFSGQPLNERRNAFAFILPRWGAAVLHPYTEENHGRVGHGHCRAGLDGFRGGWRFSRFRRRCAW